MADRSLIYFLSFLIVIVTYCFYEKHAYSEKLFKLASDQQAVIQKQEKAISAQETYIKFLEVQLVAGYYKKNSSNHPLYD